MNISNTLLTIFPLLILIAIVEIKITAQTPNANEERRSAANKLFDEGFGLFQQRTLKSHLSALEKFQLAIKIYEEIGDNSENYGLSWLVSGLISDELEGRKSL